MPSPRYRPLRDNPRFQRYKRKKVGNLTAVWLKWLPLAILMALMLLLLD